MEQINTTQATEDNSWPQISTDLATGFGGDYHATVEQDGKIVDIDITMSPGGASEGGYEVTVIAAAIPNPGAFNFTIHPQDFLTEIGKFFGGEDVITGYAGFDDNTIVKTNDPQRARTLLANDEARQVFQNLSGYALTITKDKNTDADILELMIQRGLTNVTELKRVYNAFFTVLEAVYQA